MIKSKDLREKKSKKFQGLEMKAFDKQIVINIYSLPVLKMWEADTLYYSRDIKTELRAEEEIQWDRKSLWKNSRQMQDTHGNKLLKS